MQQLLSDISSSCPEIDVSLGDFFEILVHAIDRFWFEVYYLVLNFIIWLYAVWRYLSYCSLNAAALPIRDLARLSFSAVHVGLASTSLNPSEAIFVLLVVVG